MLFILIVILQFYSHYRVLGCVYLIKARHSRPDLFQGLFQLPNLVGDILPTFGHICKFEHVSNCNMAAWCTLISKNQSGYLERELSNTDGSDSHASPCLVQSDRSWCPPRTCKSCSCCHPPRRGQACIAE